MTIIQTIQAIAKIIRTQGKLLECASSIWQTDVYELKGVAYGMNYVGCCGTLMWGERLRVSVMYAHPIPSVTFYKGDENELNILYQGVMNNDDDGERTGS